MTFLVVLWVEMSPGRKETVERPLARDGKGLSKASVRGNGRKGLIGVTSEKCRYSVWGSWLGEGWKEREQ